MDRERVLSILRDHEPELKANGIAHLRLFGSVARGDQTQSSDIDLLAEFNDDARMTLVKFARLQYDLSVLIGSDVDLVSSQGLREYFRKQVSEEAILAF
jgi:predicted nucleotidyltransferase